MKAEKGPGQVRVILLVIIFGFAAAYFLGAIAGVGAHILWTKNIDPSGHGGQPLLISGVLYAAIAFSALLSGVLFLKGHHAASALWYGTVVLVVADQAVTALKMLRDAADLSDAIAMPILLLGAGASLWLVHRRQSVPLTQPETSRR